MRSLDDFEIFLDVSRTITRSTSGVENVVRNLALQVKPKNLLIFEGSSYRRVTGEELQRFGIELNHLDDSKGIQFNFGDIILIPEIFQVNSSFTNFWNSPASSGLLPIPFIHDLLPLENPEWFPSHILSDFLLYASSLRGFTSTLSNSQRTLDTFNSWCELSINLLNHDKNRRNVVVPLPHAEMHFECDLKQQTTAKNIQEITILQVGNFDPRKNLEFSETLVRKLVKDGYTVNLNLVGANIWHIEGWLENLKNSLSRNLQINVFLNLPDDQLELLWLQADILFYFSFAEGFGLPISEGLFRKIPTIVNKELPAAKLSKSPHLWAVDINDIDSTYLTLLSSINHVRCTGVRTRLDGKLQLEEAWEKWASLLIKELSNLNQSHNPVGEE